MEPVDDFGTNRHSPHRPKLGRPGGPSRYPDLCFADGNVAVVAGAQYFLVHSGVLCRHSEVLSSTIKEIRDRTPPTTEEYPVVQCDDSGDDMAYFLAAIYDGVSDIRCDAHDFARAAGVLRLSTKYDVKHLRSAVLAGFARSWPKTLEEWETREIEATNPSGLYAPCISLPYPILVINLAREVGAPGLLPSAFYDLCRYLPSEAASGYKANDSKHHRLAQEDLLRMLQGREHAARFLSTFIVNELEGRQASEECLNRLLLSAEGAIVRRSECTMAFETVTFELVRDVNGLVCNRNSDVLYAIGHSLMLQTRDVKTGHPLQPLPRTCEPCRMVYAGVVDDARRELWSLLPTWFGVEVEDWPTRP
ncbi:hypothetical protein PUNSTDRAFT_98737 [Punctularia strigosozonata HHB-11173 SS5]|uniref:uncharacterized protein n=1 Tax=Punctularia strigosozonata (strain HHB-11173) TaxID=741275 RepID=UPI0004417604|nr:uncharacterized protein PUNSTDRAFT_98737 [Punctularia strigosozonata HHB-11173 SS5]EIN11581.1 hypothetical protein PUNSTDRAFT_98737 [Punctularia strigosozonata HHB-11173 SS5]